MNCEYCHIGHIQSTLVPYLQWLEGQIMVIPNAPAFSCDICGYMEYDGDFVQKLDHLLERFTENIRSHELTRQRSVITESAQWSTSRRSQ